ncbi:hypothetical protein EVAR_53804_1 [Eumeta japonica]|uniref:Uncharacterized protein n=1 Tax=Eumeta variegata TaxID=151549 RepID=A0A4C1XW44_EUMVA|nr:hypothetical protein EVAR_53804_1 [Eumeta japonica]
MRASERHASLPLGHAVLLSAIFHYFFSLHYEGLLLPRSAPVQRGSDTTDVAITNAMTKTGTDDLKFSLSIRSVPHSSIRDVITRIRFFSIQRYQQLLPTVFGVARTPTVHVRTCAHTSFAVGKQVRRYTTLSKSERSDRREEHLNRAGVTSRPRDASVSPKLSQGQHDAQDTPLYKTIAFAHYMSTPRIALKRDSCLGRCATSRGIPMSTGTFFLSLLQESVHLDPFNAGRRYYTIPLEDQNTVPSVARSEPRIRTADHRTRDPRDRSELTLYGPHFAFIALIPCLAR